MNLLPPRLVAGLAWALVERKKRSVARKQSSPKVAIEQSLLTLQVAISGQWSFGLVIGFVSGHDFGRADRSKLRPALAAEVEVLAVQNRWKSCGHYELTGERRNDSFTRFRGQSNSHSCEFAWTEGAPLRRKAIRSLTIRLNVPVVREKFGHKSERNSQDSLRAYGYGATSAFYPSADIRFQTRV